MSDSRVDLSIKLRRGATSELNDGALIKHASIVMAVDPSASGTTYQTDARRPSSIKGILLSRLHANQVIF